MAETKHRSPERALIAAAAAAEKQAEDILVLDVSEVMGITDHFVICTGNNPRQVATIVDEVRRRMKAAGTSPYRVEGEQESRWVLLDYLDVIVHVFAAEEREFYGLERLWKDAPVVPFEPGVQEQRA